MVSGFAWMVHSPADSFEWVVVGVVAGWLGGRVARWLDVEAAERQKNYVWRER